MNQFPSFGNPSNSFSGKVSAMIDLYRWSRQAPRESVPAATICRRPKDPAGVCGDLHTIRRVSDEICIYTRICIAAKQGWLTTAIVLLVSVTPLERRVHLLMGARFDQGGGRGVLFVVCSVAVRVHSGDSPFALLIFFRVRSRKLSQTTRRVNYRNRAIVVNMQNHSCRCGTNTAINCIHGCPR